MTIKTLEDLFIHELSDTHSAERQMAKALQLQSVIELIEQQQISFKRYSLASNAIF